jgi:hypothetical protein
VNNFPKSVSNARTETDAAFVFDLHAGQPHPLQRRASGALPITLLLIILFTCNVLTTIAQSEATAKPAATAATPAAEKPVTRETTSPPITGSIRGKLTASDGQPIMNANIIIQSLSGTPVAKPTRPDAEGRFVFDDLAPGAYIVMAMAPGYIDQSMELGNPLQWPRHLIGSNVNVSLIRGGVITGLVTNPKGEPIVGVPVRATLVSSQALSAPVLMSGNGMSETDDRGVYRIYGLLPGQYTVQAGGKGSFGQFGATGFDIDVPIYYPSSTRDTAVPISVRSGDETTGIDIKYKPTDGHSISGVVLGNIGASAAVGAVTIMLAHASTASVLSVTIASVTEPRRAFSFNGIADGEYDVFASYLTDPNENALIGTKRISVRGGDLTGLELSLAPLGSLAGTITLDPVKPEARCDKRGSQVIETILKLAPDDPKKVNSNPMTSMFAGLGKLTDKGEFTLRNLDPTKYRFDIKLPTDSWYLRAINLPARAAQTTTPTAASAQPALPDKPAQPPVVSPNATTWQGILTIKPGDSISGVSIMVGQDAAVLRGRAAPEGTVREGMRIHLVPVDREQANNVLRYSETLVKRDGTFSLTNLAPGRYFILARVEPPTETDAATRPVAWNAAERVKLRREAEAAKIEVELKPCQSMADYQLKPIAVQ